MNAQAIAGYVDSEELRAVFARLSRPGACFILEGFADLQIGEVGAAGEAGEQDLDPSSYEEGRLFDSVFELHWQRLRGYPAHVPLFRVSLVSDDEGQVNGAASGSWLTSSGVAAAPVPLEQAGGSSVYLWGEAVAGAEGKPTGQWYEKEVPRLFGYPLDQTGGNPRVKLVTKSYRFRHAPGQTTDEEAGALQRFVGFTTA